MSTMLTTYDNVYNPFDDFEKWFVEDLRLGHNTCGHFANVCKFFQDRPDSELSDEEINEINEKAMDFMIAYDPFKIYRKVSM